MSVGLYMEVHVPAAITRGLVLRGVDVLTAQLDNTTVLDDPDLLNRATEMRRVLFSQDDAAAAFWRILRRRHLCAPASHHHWTGR